MHKSGQTYTIAFAAPDGGNEAAGTEKVNILQQRQAEIEMAEGQ